MKKILCMLLALMLAVSALAACSRNKVEDTVSSGLPSAPVSSAPKASKMVLCIDFGNEELETAFLARMEEWGNTEEYELLRSQDELPQDSIGLAVTDSASTLQSDITIAYDGADVSGVSSTVSLIDLIDLALENDPAAKTLGVLYAADNEAAAAQVQEAQNYCAQRDISLEPVAVNNGEEEVSPQTVTELCARVDALLTLMESLLGAVEAETIAQAAAGANIPWYAQDAAMVESGALAAISPDYESLANAAADMCVQLLLGQSAAQVPARTVEEKKITVNSQVLETLGGITLSREILETADFIGEKG